MREILIIEVIGLWVGLVISVMTAVALFRIRSAVKRIIMWPQIKARVLPDTLVFRRAGRFSIGNGKFFRISSVMFEYEIDGCTQRSRNLLPVNWTIRESEQDRVRRELETFAVAFCNPKDCAEAYLDIPDRWQRGSISWVTVGLLLACITSALLVLMLLEKYA